MSEVIIYNQLIGQIATEVYREFHDKKHDDDERLIIKLENGKSFQFLHFQDCCENVFIEDIVGDLKDLIGSPIFMAEGVSHSSEENMPDDLVRQDEYSYTWTFYKFATAKGYVTVRWLGTSNGYYSEAVEFEEIKEVK